MRVTDVDEGRPAKVGQHVLLARCLLDCDRGRGRIHLASVPPSRLSAHQALLVCLAVRSSALLYSAPLRCCRSVAAGPLCRSAPCFFGRRLSAPPARASELDRRPPLAASTRTTLRCAGYFTDVAALACSAAAARLLPACCRPCRAFALWRGSRTIPDLRRARRRGRTQTAWGHVHHTARSSGTRRTVGALCPPARLIDCGARLIDCGARETSSPSVKASRYGGRSPAHHRPQHTEAEGRDTTRARANSGQTPRGPTSYPQAWRGIVIDADTRSACWMALAESDWPGPARTRCRSSAVCRCKKTGD
jgi:hypothetical protein